VIVVGAAILRNGRLLAAQRAHPPTLAGWWELPGGKVEPGEDENDALVRECREELHLELTLGPRLGPDLPIGDDGTLRVWAAYAVDGVQPVSREHAALRWVGRDELDELPWLPADRPLLPYLRTLLAQ
jgi:8-oxo-dGTP diphosphatase